MVAPNEGSFTDRIAADEKVIDRAGRAFDRLVTAAQKAALRSDANAIAARSDARTMSIKAMGFAEINVRSAFDLARKLVRAKDLQEVLALQSEYAKSQLSIIQEQARELGSLLQSSVQEKAQPVPSAGLMTTDEVEDDHQTNDALRTIGARFKPRDVDDAAYAVRARDKAALKGIQISRQDLIDAGGAFDVEQVKELLNTDADGVNHLVRDKVIIYVVDSNKETRFPAFQFGSDGTPLSGLNLVLEALPTQNPWAILNFMVRSNSHLGGRKPMDLLKAKDLDAVLAAARSIGVQGY